jgi:hypothetical protein
MRICQGRKTAGPWTSLPKMTALKVSRGTLAEGIGKLPSQDWSSVLLPRDNAPTPIKKSLLTSAGELACQLRSGGSKGQIRRPDLPHLARLDEYLGQAHAFGRRGGVAGGVIVNDDDRRCVVLDGVAEQLGHADDVGLEATDVDGGNGQNPIVRINSDCNTIWRCQ